MADTNNHDILSLSRRLNDYSYEMSKCPSANLVAWREADLERLDTYMDALEGFKAWVISQPEQDVPETHPQVWSEDDARNFGYEMVENQMANDIIHMMWLLKYELLHSQSTRLPGGLMVFDSQRYDDSMIRLRNFVDNYVKTFTPLDQPESSPEEISVTPGRRGSTRS